MYNFIKEKKEKSCCVSYASQIFICFYIIPGVFAGTFIFYCWIMHKLHCCYIMETTMLHLLKMHTKTNINHALIKLDLAVYHLHIFLSGEHSWQLQTGNLSYNPLWFGQMLPHPIFHLISIHQVLDRAIDRWTIFFSSRYLRKEIFTLFKLFPFLSFKFALVAKSIRYSLW